MVIEGSPTKAVTEEVKPADPAEPAVTGKEEIKNGDTGEGGDSDTEFTVETAEMDELEESSSDSEGEDEEAVQENFTIEVQNGEARKLKFPQEAETQETETQESQGLEALENTMDDEDDENDKDFNPCHVSLIKIIFEGILPPSFLLGKRYFLLHYQFFDKNFRF